MKKNREVRIFRALLEEIRKKRDQCSAAKDETSLSSRYIS